jgi:hypothetical protein
VGRQPGQQPAGVHEVPVPGAQAGLSGRGGQPVPGAGAGALLGALERRVGGVRHEDERPPRTGASGGGRGAGQRRAQGAPRPRGGGQGVRGRAHRGFDEVVAALDGSPWTICWAWPGWAPRWSTPS